jgi:hypothetical protein
MIIFHADTFYIRITIIDAIKNTKQRHRFVPYNLDQLLEIMSGDARSGNANKISSGFGIPCPSRVTARRGSKPSSDATEVTNNDNP